MTHHHPLRRSETAMVDVLVAAANVGRYDLQDDAVIALLAAWADQLGIVERLNLDLARSQECYDSIACHDFSFLLYVEGLWVSWETTDAPAPAAGVPMLAPIGITSGREANCLRTALAAASDDAGFWPVTRLPSTTT